MHSMLQSPSSSYHASREPFQELQLLLGLCSILCISYQPPSLYLSWSYPGLSLPHPLLRLRVGELHHPHSTEELAASRIEGEEDSLSKLQPSLTDAEPCLMSKLYVRNWGLDLILYHD